MQYLSVTRCLFSVEAELAFSLPLWLLSLFLWNHSCSHLPVKTAPRHLFVWLQQKIAQCHSAFVMIVLFSTAICAQWVILTFLMFILYDYTLQQNFERGLMLVLVFLWFAYKRINQISDFATVVFTLITSLDLFIGWTTFTKLYIGKSKQGTYSIQHVARIKYI